MKRSVIVCVAALVAAASLSGCAAVHENQASNQLLKSPIDTRYVSAVETMGKRVGNRVYWVNPPKRDNQDSN